jgi:hypothetical protein
MAEVRLLFLTLMIDCMTFCYIERYLPSVYW